MPTLRSLRAWLRLPSRAALILGLGALPTTGVQADAPEQSNLRSFGDMLIRSEGSKIYLSEGGEEFTELQLKDSAEARYLKQLLGRNETAAGPAGLRLSPTVLAGGGGMGFYWSPFAKTNTPDKTGAREKEGARGKATTSEEAGAPRKPDPPAIEKTK